MEDERAEQQELNVDIDHRWYIAILADGNYYFITPETHADVVKYIGEHGGGLYTHAGYLVMTADVAWWRFLTRKYDAEHGHKPIMERPPHIDVPNIECRFSKSALKWLEENDELLKEVGGKYYDFIPRH